MRRVNHCVDLNTRRAMIINFESEDLSIIHCFCNLIFFGFAIGFNLNYIFDLTVKSVLIHTPLPFKSMFISLPLHSFPFIV
jgi:hypothetical protein